MAAAKTVLWVSVLLFALMISPLGVVAGIWGGAIAQLLWPSESKALSHRRYEPKDFGGISHK